MAEARLERAGRPEPRWLEALCVARQPRKPKEREPFILRIYIVGRMRMRELQFDDR